MFQRRDIAHRVSVALGVAVAVIVTLAGCSTSSPGNAGASETPGATSKVATQTAGVLSVCVNLGTPPNEFATASGEPQGAEIDLATALAKEMSLKAQFVQLSFSGLIPALQAKQCDVIMSSLYIKPEREKVVDFVPYLTSGSGVAVAKDNPKNITGYDDSLCGTKVLTQAGATGADLAAEMSKTCVTDGKRAIDISVSDANGAGLQQVIAGQVDAFIDTSGLVGYYQKLSKGDFKLVGESFGLIKIGAATIKGDSTLHGAIAGVFDQLISSGAYEKILVKWGMEKQTIVGS